MPSVTMPACAPVSDTALAPSPCNAMASSAMVVCSPVASNMSISRSFGSGWTSFASLISESVTPLIAETTATTLLPACCVANTRRAQFLIRSGLPTDVPPYFCTIKAMGIRNLKSEIRNSKQTINVFGLVSYKCFRISRFGIRVFRLDTDYSQHFIHIRLAGGGRGGVRHGGVGVFQSVAGQCHDQRRAFGENAACQMLAEARNAGSRGGLDEDPFLRREKFVGVENFGVAHHVDQPARLIAGGFGEFPTCRIADANGGGDGLRFLDRMTAHDGRGALGLKPDHFGYRVGDFLRAVFLVA